MARILFWNLQRKDLNGLLGETVKSYNVDLVAVVENDQQAVQTLSSLRALVTDEFYIPTMTTGRFQVFSRSAELTLAEVYSGNRISIWRLKATNVDLMLGFVHLWDKRNWDELNQAAQVQLLASEIRDTEKKIGHDRTMLIGDFNLNPFDKVMNMALGLNAMMTQKCITKEKRKQQDQDYPFFYNPMWGLFGDRTTGPPGTYYHTSASTGMYGWNMLDQLLVRKSALDFFGDVRACKTISYRIDLAVGQEDFRYLRDAGCKCC